MICAERHSFGFCRYLCCFFFGLQPSNDFWRSKVSALILPPLHPLAPAIIITPPNPGSSALHAYVSPSLRPPLLVAALSPLPLVPDTSLTSPAPFTRRCLAPNTTHYSLQPSRLSISPFFLPLLPIAVPAAPLPLHPPLYFLTLYVSLENFLLCSICPFPTSPTPFQQTHLLNGCSPYIHAGRQAHTRGAELSTCSSDSPHSTVVQQQGECLPAEFRTAQVESMIANLFQFWTFRAFF